MPEQLPESPVSIPALQRRRSEHAAAVESLSRQIDGAEKHLRKLRNDLIATSGAVQCLDQLIADASAVPAAPACPPQNPPLVDERGGPRDEA
jgi:hypothetical protein